MKNRAKSATSIDAMVQPTNTSRDTPSVAGAGPIRRPANVSVPSDTAQNTAKMSPEYIHTRTI